MECDDIQHKFLLDAVRQFLETAPHEGEINQAALLYLVRAYEACK